MEYLMKRNSFETLRVIVLTTLFGILAWGSGLQAFPSSADASEVADAASAPPTDESAPDLSDSERATIHDMLIQAQSAPNRSPAIVNGDENGTADEELPDPEAN
jgi:hypothetical protein